MRSTRTQVYLTEEQRRQIDEIAAADGLTMAEVVRRALDLYLAKRVDPEQALSATFGADPEAEVVDRSEWTRG